HESHAHYHGDSDDRHDSHGCHHSDDNRHEDDECHGRVHPPALSAGSLIEVLVSTSINKTGSTIYGNIAGIVVLRVDNPTTHAPDPGHAGFGTIVSVVAGSVVTGGSGGTTAVANLLVTQTQPSTVQPGQLFNTVVT